MGYRSDVAYTIRFKEVGKMVMFMTEAKSKGLQPALDECEIHEDKLQINFHATNVKWYESYPDVQAHQSLMQLARDWCGGDEHQNIKDGGLGYEGASYALGFVRAVVGENIDDNEEETEGFGDWEWLRVSREIVGDWL